MGLVKIEDFESTIIQDVVDEVLAQMGLTDMLNSNGYTISINSIQDKTPLGYIEDDPENYNVSISKLINIGKASDLFFVKGKYINKASEEYKESLDALESLNFKFSIPFGLADIREVSEIIFSVDTRYCNYKHEINIRINRGNKDEENYVDSIIKSVLATVVGK